MNIKIVVLNNFGYGIIKQFQDSYFESRYEASGRGYSQPDIRKIARLASYVRKQQKGENNDFC